MSTELHDIGDADRATLAGLERWLPRVSPPGATLDRILAEIEPEATVVPLRPRARRHRLVATGAALTAAAAVVAVAVGERGSSLRGQADARAAIAGTSDPTVTGEAEIRGADTAGGTVRVTLRNVPPAPRRHHYEVWVLRRDSTGKMESIGTFTPSTQTVRLELPLPGAGDYAAVDISVEPDGGPPAHSDTSLASGTFS